MNLLNPHKFLRHPNVQLYLREKIRSADVIVCHNSHLEALGSKEIFEKKDVIVDYLTPQQKDEFRESGVGGILELMPYIPVLGDHIRSLGEIHGVLDLIRNIQAEDSSFSEFMAQILERYSIRPSKMQHFQRIKVRGHQ